MGAEAFSKEALTATVTVSGALMKLQMRLGLWSFCSTETKRKMWNRAPNRQMASSSVRMMLKPRRERSRIYICHKDVAVGVRVDVCGPLEMELWIVDRDHSG